MIQVISKHSVVDPGFKVGGGGGGGGGGEAQMWQLCTRQRWLAIVQIGADEISSYNEDITFFFVFYHIYTVIFDAYC